MKVAYIIPWFKSNCREMWFQVVWDFFESKWIMPVFVDIKWKRQTISQYLDQFNRQILNPEDEIYILWFSYWAIIALLSASKLNVRELFLCSLSPFFNEDYKYLKKWWLNSNWKRRNEEFEKLSFDEIAKDINCKTNIFFWDKEEEVIKNRAYSANLKIKNSTICEVYDSRHNINERRYLESLEIAIGNII
ncbi:MAG: hypothetical protein ACD_2C00221G0014 [uncultured bacterium (gcode 4)]|uniref:Alpha/beta hydrolase n=1 Tax=uncultured bacterium (gcode 4) TaxID=1234023 RepID=K2G4B0_9BACT|nr:MAG: hypothetical protein ACD_2C00221G0014 [uncultured bacterium (gcode 4)]